MIDKQVNDELSKVVHYRDRYEDVLSYTTSWHLGQASQRSSRSGSRAGSQCSRASVHTTASELERRQKLEAQQRAHLLAVELHSEQAKTAYLDWAIEEERNAREAALNADD